MPEKVKEEKKKAAKSIISKVAAEHQNITNSALSHSYRPRPMQDACVQCALWPEWKAASLLRLDRKRNMKMLSIRYSFV